MGIDYKLDPKDWSILRAIFSSSLRHITLYKVEVDVLLYLADLSIRRRRVSTSKTIVAMMKEDDDPDCFAFTGYSYSYLVKTIQSLESFGKIIKTNKPKGGQTYTINMVGILDLYLKMLAYKGVTSAAYANLLSKVMTVFPTDYPLIPISAERGMGMLTIEEAVSVGLKNRSNRSEAQTSFKEITARSLTNYMTNAAKIHSKTLYLSSGVKSVSILRRFIKDCVELGITAYEVVDYILDHYQELNVYSQQNESFNLDFSTFDFEKIYYNKKEILVWFLHTKEHGFYDVNKSVIEQAGESIGIKVIPFKKRIQK